MNGIAHSWIRVKSAFGALLLLVVSYSEGAHGDMLDFYTANINYIVTQQCYTCHRAGSSQLLPFTTSPDRNHQVFLSYVNSIDRGNRLLAKIRGDLGHGGGVQVPQASADYGNFENYVGQILASPTTTFDVMVTVGANGSVSPSSTQSVVEGGSATFAIDPNPGYEISSVDGTCGGTLVGSTFTTDAIISDCTVIVAFSVLPSFLVTPSVGPNGSINPSVVQTVSSGSTISFTISSNSGYEISGVDGTCGGTLSGSTYTTRPVTANCTVAAAFSQIPTFTVTPTAGNNGSISPLKLQSVTRGLTTSFLITPDSGFEIAEVGGTCGGSLTGSTYVTNVVTADCSVTATFSAIFEKSCETFGTSGSYVQKIFIAYLGRPAAPAGLEYFANFMDTDNDQGKLVLFDDLYYSVEAKALYSTMTLSERINQFYQFMFNRDALSAGLNYWINEVNDEKFTIPESAAYIADAASGDDIKILDAKQVAASKLTCAIGDDSSKLTGFRANLSAARASIETVKTAEEAEAYDGDAELASIMGSAKAAPGTWPREASKVDNNYEAVESIPLLPTLNILFLSGIIGFFGLWRLALTPEKF